MIMRRHCALLATVLMIAGCASSADDDPNAPKVTVHLAQLDSGGGNNTFYSGSVNLQFALSVSNTTKDLVTLSRLQVRTVSSGAYSIPPTSTSLNLAVSPGQSVATTIAVWGYARGGNMSSQEPVTLRGTAYFSGPSGAFVRLFTEYIDQR
jgi:hypothetical protein